MGVALVALVGSVELGDFQFPAIGNQEMRGKFVITCYHLT
jgi:hypothetical protein